MRGAGVPRVEAAGECEIRRSTSRQDPIGLCQAECIDFGLFGFMPVMSRTLCLHRLRGV